MSMGRFAVVGCAVGLGCGVARGDVPHDWMAALSGDWSDPANWAGGDIPDVSNECAVFALVGAYTVTDSATRTFGGYRLTNPAVTLLVSNATHNIFGDVVNRGSIVVDGAGLEFGFADRRIDGDGVITLGSAGSTGRIDSDDAMLTHGAGHTIAGNGVLEGFLGGPWVNEGTITANDALGSGIEFDANMTQAGAGRIGANGGTLLLKNGSSMSGGVLFNVNGGKLKVDGPYVLSGIVAAVSDLQIEGRIDVEDDYKVLEISGAIENNGQIVINGNLDADDAELSVVADTTLSGDGEVVLRASGAQQARLVVSTDANLTIGPDMTVRGSGVFQSSSTTPVTNNGVILAEDPVARLVLSRDFTGSGVFGANDAELFIGEFADLFGCTLDSSGTGEIVIGEYVIDFVEGRNEGKMRLLPGADLAIEGIYENNGVIEQPAANFDTEPVTLRNGASIVGDGVMRFTDAFARGGLRASGGQATVGAQQTLAGEFLLDGDFLIQGVIEPEGTVEIVDGDVVLDAGTRVRMEIGDSIGGDEIEIGFGGGQSLTLGGSLLIEPEPGYTPAIGGQWLLISGDFGTDLFGAFDTVVAPAPPAGGVYTLTEVASGLRLTLEAAPCPADLAEPYGVLDFSDVVAFLTAFGSMSAEADLAEPFGQLDFSDVVAFLSSFGAGCP